MRIIALTLLSAFVVAPFFATAQTEARLKILNRVMIRISGVPEDDRAMVSDEYVISEQGFVKLPYIGKVNASGLTATGLGEKIEATFIARKIYTRPVVICVHSETGVNARKVTVGGEVKRVGQVAFFEGMTLFQAITSAGGPTDWGNMKKIKVIRGTRMTYHDMRRVTSNRTINIVLQPDDQVVVPHR